VQKWDGRHQAGGQEWAAGRKRGPKHATNRTPAELERQVVAVRERLAANPWAQVGAEAIAWELEKVGVEPPPRRTLEGIVARNERRDPSAWSGAAAVEGRSGLPPRQQFDNGGPYVAPRGLVLIVRLCLHQGVTPQFVPPSEPCAERDGRALQ
jgi:hypothetical protein